MRMYIVGAAVGAALLAAGCAQSPTSTTPVTTVDTVAVNGFQGAGSFTYDTTMSVPFQLLVSDTASASEGSLAFVSNGVPPQGLYNLDAGTFPLGAMNFNLQFLRPTSDSTSDVYDAYGGQFRLTQVSADSIAGTVDLFLTLSAYCVGADASGGCQAAAGTGILQVSGGFSAANPQVLATAIRRVPAGLPRATWAHLAAPLRAGR